MANVNGGIIVVGVAQNKDKHNSRASQGFCEKGFDKGQEDNVITKIVNEIYKIDPNPTVQRNLVYTDSKDKFYVVLKVTGNISEKPYVLKDQGKIFVRIDSSNKPASRTAMLNLFSDYTKRKSDIQRLRATLNLFKQLFDKTSKQLSYIRFPDNQYGLNLPTINTSLLIDTILCADWFLEEKQLLGGYNYASNPPSEMDGLYSVIFEVEGLNALIEQFNSRNPHTNLSILKSNINGWEQNQTDYLRVLNHINRIINECDNFLKKA